VGHFSEGFQGEERRGVSQRYYLLASTLDPDPHPARNKGEHWACWLTGGGNVRISLRGAGRERNCGVSSAPGDWKKRNG